MENKEGPISRRGGLGMILLNTIAETIDGVRARRSQKFRQKMIDIMADSVRRNGWDLSSELSLRFLSKEDKAEAERRIRDALEEYKYYGGR